MKLRHSDSSNGKFQGAVIAKPGAEIAKPGAVIAKPGAVIAKPVTS